MHIDSRHCLYRDGKCANCDQPMRHWLLLRLCADGTSDTPPVSRKIRPRTDEEYAEISKICYTCPHITTESHEYGSGLCGLNVKSGCGSCKSQAAFAKWKRSGAGCKDNPARFPATEVVE